MRWLAARRGFIMACEEPFVRTALCESTVTPQRRWRAGHSVCRSLSTWAAGPGPVELLTREDG
jgi:hypothetical protein